MNASAESLRALTRHASLDDIHRLAQSPAPFHVRLQRKTDQGGEETGEHAFGHVDVEDRILVVGKVPNCADSFVVKESDIVHLSVIYD